MDWSKVKRVLLQYLYSWNFNFGDSSSWRYFIKWENEFEHLNKVYHVQFYLCFLSVFWIKQWQMNHEYRNKIVNESWIIRIKSRNHESRRSNDSASTPDAEVVTIKTHKTNDSKHSNKTYAKTPRNFSLCTRSVLKFNTRHLAHSIMCTLQPLDIWDNRTDSCCENLFFDSLLLRGSHQ